MYVLAIVVLFYPPILLQSQWPSRTTTARAKKRSSMVLRTGLNKLTLRKLCLKKKKSEMWLMDLVQSPSPPLKLRRKRKTTLLPPKSSSKGSTATSISTLLEKKIPRDLGKLFAKFAPKSIKKLSILYSKNCSTIQKLPNYLDMKRRPSQYLLRLSF